MTKISNIEKLQPEVAKVIIDADGQNRRAVKKDAINDLQQMLASGKITKEEFINAKKVLSDRSVMKAVTAENRMEANVEKQTLQDKKAQRIMEQAGLTVDDLYQVAGKFVGDDNKVSYTYLNLSEKKKAKAGEETSSERYNVLNALNEKIKENGGDRELTLKEAKILMKGLGCDIESPVDPGFVVFAAMGHPVALGLAIAKPFIKEQGVVSLDGEEGGQGSVTNKVEAKMKALEERANAKPDKVEEPPVEVAEFGVIAPSVEPRDTEPGVEEPPVKKTYEE